MLFLGAWPVRRCAPGRSPLRWLAVSVGLSALSSDDTTFVGPLPVGQAEDPTAAHRAANAQFAAAMRVTDDRIDEVLTELGGGRSTATFVDDICTIADATALLSVLGVELVDLREHPLPRFDGMPPARTPRDYPSDEVARLGRTIDRADGYIVLAAEYYHGYPAVLKNAMESTCVEWWRKPVSYVGWGGVGGARAVEQLRQVAVEFEMAPLPHALHILPDVIVAARKSADSRGPTAFAPLNPKLEELVDDLTWWAAALRTARRSEQG